MRLFFISLVILTFVSVTHQSNALKTAMENKSSDQLLKLYRKHVGTLPDEFYIHANRYCSPTKYESPFCQTVLQIAIKTDFASGIKILYQVHSIQDVADKGMDAEDEFDEMFSTSLRCTANHVSSGSESDGTIFCSEQEKFAIVADGTRAYSQAVVSFLKHAFELFNQQTAAGNIRLFLVAAIKRAHRIMQKLLLQGSCNLSLVCLDNLKLVCVTVGQGSVKVVREKNFLFEVTALEKELPMASEYMEVNVKSFVSDQIKDDNSLVDGRIRDNDYVFIGITKSILPDSAMLQYTADDVLLVNAREDEEVRIVALSFKYTQ